ncbi:MAG: hypothetical protein ACXWSD_02210 [Bdellovibrionota bacterium]
MKNLTTTLNRALMMSLLSLSLASLPAFAVGGQDSGGGNLLNHALVEDYAVDSQALPGIGEVEPYLKALDERVPAFALELRGFLTQPSKGGPKDVQWYLIPEKIRDLPTETTGFSFSSDQAAEQFGKEVFVSQVDMADQKPNVQGRFYLHELVEMAHPTKDITSVRKLMIFLKTNNFAPPQEVLVDMLYQLGFGSFDSKNTADAKKAQREADKAVIVKTLQKRWEKSLVYFNRNCNEKFMGLFQPGSAPQALDPSLAAVTANYRYVFAAEKESSDPQLTPSQAAMFHDVVSEYRNNMWKNEHFASLHAALDPGVKTGDYRSPPHFNDTPYYNDEFSSWLGLENDQATPPQTEGFVKVEKYQKKYAKLSMKQRLLQACSDFNAIVAAKKAGEPDPGVPGSADSQSGPGQNSDAK